MALLNAQHLFKKYENKETPAVNNISISIKKGEVLAIVGESGSGKSTLLKMLGGLLDADEGEVFFEKEKVFGPSEKLLAGHKHIETVYQNYALFPHHSVYDNLEHRLRHLPNFLKEDTIYELLELFHLSSKRDKLPRELSGGEQQRVAIARALAKNPKLLLMDEPFSNLDILLREEIKEALIKKIKRDKIAAIIVTHDAMDALSLADHILVMKEGEMIQKGDPEKIYFAPKTSYVAGLFGIINMVERKSLENEVKILTEQNKKIKGDYYCFRAEALKETKAKDALIKGSIIELKYKGSFQEVTIKTASGILLKYFSTDQTNELGKKCFLTIDEKYFLLLNE